ncbi:MAG: hypothetical protein VYA30_05310 [Myxococcota bacterium]|nr:hypothetical protein [Myxococcota bacterium]
MSSNFRLSGYQRRIARTVVDAMVPRWTNFGRELTPDVLDGVENMIRNYPAFVRFGIRLMLLFVEFGGPLTLTGIVPLSFLSRRKVTIRLERLSNHRFATVRNVPKFLKILVCFNAYSRQDVEAYLGADRRIWRKQRVEFRDRLVQLDESRDRPPTPHALGTYGTVSTESYLDENRRGAATLNEQRADS